MNSIAISSLRPGISLTAAQMAQLSSDIVWLVEQEVTLADGAKQKVLVPQVYVRVREGDIDGSGALLAGSSIDMNLTGDLTNSGTVSGTLAGRSIVAFEASNRPLPLIQLVREAINKIAFVRLITDDPSPASRYLIVTDPRFTSYRQRLGPDYVLSALGLDATSIAIEAATNLSSASSLREEKRSGLMSSGGLGFAIGKREQSTDQQSQSTSAAASTVGAITGNVTLVAGNQYRQVGSDIVAPNGDVTVAGKAVNIQEARETSQSQTEQKSRQSGLTLSISNPVISAAQTVQGMGQAASNTSDARMQGLALASSALAARGAINAVQAGQGSTINGKDGQIATGNDASGNPTSRDATAADKVGGINLNISLGSSRSQSNSASQSETARRSTVPHCVVHEPAR